MRICNYYGYVNEIRNYCNDNHDDNDDDGEDGDGEGDNDNTY